MSETTPLTLVGQTVDGYRVDAFPAAEPALEYLRENKDVLLFPEKIGGRYAALHRPNPATHFAHPEIWLAYSDDLLRWGDHAPLLGGGSAWDAGRVGGGCPPVRTRRTFIELCHSLHGSRPRIQKKTG